MKVQLLADYHTPSLKLNRIYCVVSVEIYKDKRFYRIFSENESPALFDCEMFKVVSNKIPSEWGVFYNNETNYIDLCPESWMKDDFWERYFDAEPDAIAEFERLRQLIEADS